MKQQFQLRVNGKYASLLFASHEGVVLPLTAFRKITLESSDPRLAALGELDAKTRSGAGDCCISSWDMVHRYTQRELCDAELFQIWITPAFEPTVAQCGVRYDEVHACPHCGVGRFAASPWRLDLNKLPKKKDFARSIADEWVCSQRAAQVIVDEGITGLELRPVSHKVYRDEDPIDLSTVPSGRLLLLQAEALGLHRPTWAFYVWLNRPEQQTLWWKAIDERAAFADARQRCRPRRYPTWYQLVFTAAPADIIAPTRTGISPFDLDDMNEFRCPAGHVIGLNLLSEVFIARDSWQGADLAITRQMTGRRSGLLQAKPSLLASPRFWRVVEKHDLKGLRREVAYLR